MQEAAARLAGRRLRFPGLFFWREETPDADALCTTWSKQSGGGRLTITANEKYTVTIIWEKQKQVSVAEKQARDVLQQGQTI